MKINLVFLQANSEKRCCEQIYWLDSVQVFRENGHMLVLTNVSASVLFCLKTSFC